MPPLPLPPASPPPTRTPPHPHKSVSFCSHCKHDDTYTSDRDIRYYSDPGRTLPSQNKTRKRHEDRDERYYSEPDVKYFEIDYEFLKELKQIAKHNCPKCRKRRKEKERSVTSVEKDKQEPKYAETKEKPRYSKTTRKPVRSVRMRESYVFCNGRYHSSKEHCQLCCKVCNRSTDTLDSIDDEYSLVSKSYSSRATTSSRSKSTPRCDPGRKNSSTSTRERKNSIQSIKSVSFLESGNEEKDETNYTAKSFTNDLKKFLLKPSAPRLSFRDKFMNSFKQEFQEATKKSPKLKAIKGLWKSY